MTGSYVP